MMGPAGVGFLYDVAALDAAWSLVKDRSMEEREALRNAVPAQGLESPIQKCRCPRIQVGRGSSRAERCQGIRSGMVPIGPGSARQRYYRNEWYLLPVSWNAGDPFSLSILCHFLTILPILNLPVFLQFSLTF